MKVRVRPLDAAADRSPFECGAPSLDNWLRRQAGQAVRKRLASVWIASPSHDTTCVLGYYSLAPWQIAFDDCPPALRRRLPHYPIHVALLARLAVAQAHQRSGLGGVLVTDAIARAWRASDALPVQGMVVHAKNDSAAAFYRSLGFLAFPHRARHLFLPMGTIAQLCGQARVRGRDSGTSEPEDAAP